MAQWSGFKDSVSFVGSIQAVEDLQLSQDLQDLVGELEQAGTLAGSALVPLADKGYTEHVGTTLPLLTSEATRDLQWPPAYDSSRSTVPIPRIEEMCGVEVPDTK